MGLNQILVGLLSTSIHNHRTAPGPEARMLDSPFRSRFQIRDLEEFSGVKAHTIRIWEKRYGLTSSGPTLTNIRTYGSRS